MIELDGELRRIASELAGLGRPFALVGGLAVSAWAEPRLTRDADLAVAVTGDAEAEALVHDLVRRGYQVVASIEHATGRLATVRLERHSSDGVVTDLLFASSGIEPEVVSAAAHISVLPRLVLPVATVGHLIAMKLLARDDRRRPLDADDLRALREVATADDWLAADDAVALIEARGYARGRDLTAALRRLQHEGAY